VRLLFTLGNLTARSNEARVRLFGCRGCPSDLLRLYRAYQPPREEEGPPSGAGAPGESGDHDVLVKLVRVLANLCVHPAAGLAMASDALCLQLLLETLGEWAERDGERQWLRKPLETSAIGARDDGKCSALRGWLQVTS